MTRPPGPKPPDHHRRHVGSLAHYPYVIVRVACPYCPKRQGAYRLARLAERFGADTPLELVLERIAFDCAYPAPYRGTGGQFRPQCHAFFPDLAGPAPRPPELPPGMAPFRVVRGGKDG